MEAFQLTDEEAEAIRSVRAWANGGEVTPAHIDNTALHALARRCGEISVSVVAKIGLPYRDAARIFIEAWDTAPAAPPEDDAIAVARKFIAGEVERMSERQTRAFVAAVLAEVVKRDEDGLPEGMYRIMVTTADEGCLLTSDEAFDIQNILAWYDAPVREDALTKARRELEAANEEYDAACVAHENAVKEMNAASRRWNAASDAMSEKRAEVARLISGGK